MIKYIIMDYEGEPVTIENGRILDVEPPRSVWHERRDKYIDSDDGDVYWDSEELDWKIEPYDYYGNDARDYGRDWYDCN